MLLRQVDIQRTIELDSLPSDDNFQLWVDRALADYSQDAEVVIRIVDTEEMAELNSQYRSKQGPTNILSFPFELPDGIEGIDLLGDLVVCSAVLEQEAKQQNKALSAHWAHIIIHGVLHLLGYDHLTDDEAIEMESKEVVLLQELHIDNPYQEKEVNG
jgi:probable rRNA maturation factor